VPPLQHQQTPRAHNERKLLGIARSFDDDRALIFAGWSYKRTFRRPSCITSDFPFHHGRDSAARHCAAGMMPCTDLALAVDGDGYPCHSPQDEAVSAIGRDRFRVFDGRLLGQHMNGEGAYSMVVHGHCASLSPRAARICVLVWYG